MTHYTKERKTIDYIYNPDNQTKSQLIDSFKKYYLGVVKVGTNSYQRQRNISNDKSITIKGEFR